MNWQSKGRGRAEEDDEVYTDKSLSAKADRADSACGGPMWERASSFCINEPDFPACFVFFSTPCL